jgi:hypothetical protein
VRKGEFVGLECKPGVVETLAGQLDRLGAIEGAASWLVSMVWLSAGDSEFLASPSTKVLADGFIARPLAIQSVADFELELETSLNDISSRLVSFGAGAQLPQSRAPAIPANIQTVSGVYSTSILIRSSARGSATHRTACGLLFDLGQRRILIGTDIRILALVFSDEDDLIERYVAGCELVPAAQYVGCAEN